MLRKDIRCTIFRHASWKTKNSNGSDGVGDPVPPHSSKKSLDRWIKENKIWGCGLPFRLLVTNNSVKPVKCGYI